MIKHEYSEAADRRLGLTGSLISVIRGTAGGYIFLILGFAILALAYTYTSLSAAMIDPIVSGITALSLILCGALSVGGVSGFGWLHGAAAGLLYSAIRLVLSAAAAKSVGINAEVLQIILVGLLLGAAGGILGINFKK